MCQLPDLPVFTIERSQGTVKIEPCPDGEGQWHWTYVPHDPPTAIQVPTGYRDMTTGEPVYAEQPWAPTLQHSPATVVLTSFTPDEARLFLGWLASLREQLVPHVTQVLAAMCRAVAEKRWDGLRALNHELAALLNMRELVVNSSRTVYDLTEASTPA